MALHRVRLVALLVVAVVLMVLLLESARHNLGAPRTINLPSLPLELLHRRNEGRFAIETSDREKVGDCQAVRLGLAETARPTIIQRPEGGDMPTHVTAWVEPDSGRLCRAQVRMRDGRLGVRISRQAFRSSSPATRRSA